jgi:deoxyadenosine/deoxycytidine kinase
MGNNKRRMTEPKKTAQRKRTNENYQKKYEKLIKKYPNHKDIGIWKDKLDQLRVGKDIK